MSGGLMMPSVSFRAFRAPVGLQLRSRGGDIALLAMLLLAVALVIVDVGHTAEAHGAMSARGVPEYEFNRRLAKLIEHDLIEAGFRKTILLITEGSATKGLHKRA